MSIDSHTPLIAELRPRSFFNRSLVCQSPLHGVEAYRFVYKKQVMTVYRHDLPIASTDGRHFLQFGDLMYRWAPGRFLRPGTELASDDEAFHFTWGEWARDPAASFNGVRVSVQGQPDEVYTLASNRSWIGFARRPHVTVQAICGKMHLDRMMALLGYFWAYEEDCRTSFG